MQLKDARVTAADGSLRDSEACIWFEVCWFDFLLDGENLDNEQATFPFIQKMLEYTCHQINHNSSVRGALWPAVDDYNIQCWEAFRYVISWVQDQFCYVSQDRVTAVLLAAAAAAVITLLLVAVCTSCYLSSSMYNDSVIWINVLDNLDKGLLYESDVQFKVSQ